MREIEFRGKRIDNGEWVYGLPMYMNYIKQFTKHEWIDNLDNNRVKTYQTSADFQIEEKTLGQYTGLKDKNGTKIFEGDIVRTQEYRTRPHSTNAKKKRFLGVVEYFEYQHHNSIAIYDNGYKVKTFEDTGEYKCFDWSYFYDCEVVGNIYDKPELVNGE